MDESHNLRSLPPLATRATTSSSGRSGRLIASKP